MPKDRRMQAIAFAQSPRGQYILSQALSVAIDTLSRVPDPLREVSDIEDMRFLRDCLFPVYAEIHEAAKDAVERVENWTQRR